MAATSDEWLPTHLVQRHCIANPRYFVNGLEGAEKDKRWTPPAIGIQYEEPSIRPIFA